MKSKNSLKDNSKLWKVAKKYIPGGNMFLSKRPDRFLPKYWPTFYKKSKGCYVTDVNNKKYSDMLMSIGTNILGYAEPNVSKAVIKSIQNGNMSTLNCVEEQLLAKKLIKMHPWSGAAKFARLEEKQMQLQSELQEHLIKKLKLQYVAIMDGMIGICRQI